MKCPNCKTENPTGVKFCHECGSKLISGKTCSHCGRGELPAEANFCPDCGNRLENQNLGQSIAQSTQQNVDNQIILFIGSNKKFGYMINGEVLIKPQYSCAKLFGEGLAPVKQGNKWGYIDQYGQEVIPMQYNNADSFSEGLACVNNNSFIDKTGRIVITLNNHCKPFSEGLARVSSGISYGFIDKSGRTVIRPKYKYATSFRQGLAAVQNSNDKYGFIDKTGKVVIPFKYDGADFFSEGVAPVRKDGKYIYIDTNNNRAIPYIYSNAEPFYEGLAFVESDEFGVAVIDHYGTAKVKKLPYDWIFQTYKNLAVVQRNSLYGIIDSSGCEIAPCIYDSISLYAQGDTTVELNGKYGQIDIFGNSTI